MTHLINNKHISLFTITILFVLLLFNAKEFSKGVVTVPCNQTQCLIEETLVGYLRAVIIQTISLAIIGMPILPIIIFLCVKLVIKLCKQAENGEIDCLQVKVGKAITNKKIMQN